jgi:hypothetical protein
VTFTLSDGTEVELRLLTRTAVLVPRQSDPDWLFEAIQADVVRPAWMAKLSSESGRS